jgi:predicted dehydrogenase
VAVTQRLKSDPTYRRVDDEATIVLTYPDAQVVIQASWNWPSNRKDMEIYGERGSLVVPDGGSYRLRIEGAGDSQAQAAPAPPPANDPISYLVAVVRGKLAPSGPSSLKTNVIAAEILDAARRSAETHRAVKLSAPE